MIKVRVINSEESVIYNGAVRRYGDEPFEMEESTAKSLMERGYVEFVTDDSDESEGEVETVNLAAMSYQDLKRFAAEHGIDSSGKKDELIERLRNYFREPDEQDEQEEYSEDYPEDEIPNTSMPE